MIMITDLTNIPEYIDAANEQNLPKRPVSEVIQVDLM